MKIGFIQFTPDFGNIERNLEKVRELSSGIDADILVLPELFNTGYLFVSEKEVEDLSEEIPGGRTTAALEKIARDRNVHITAGLAEKSGGRFFNSAVLISPQGYMATYRKIHLFSEENLWFSPGDRPFEVYDIGKCRVGVMICFDWIFPESMRVLALKGADVVCHPANLVLPYCQDAMLTRCLENRVYAVTANRTGVEERGGKVLRYTGKSQITGPDASILCRAGSGAEETGVVEIDIEAARNKRLNLFNDLFSDRRPFFYRRVCDNMGKALC
ncbi:MAG: nitrilase-related carbon-nitrogen hydrolase [Syntrophales bacterium]